MSQSYIIQLFLCVSGAKAKPGPGGNNGGGRKTTGNHGNPVFQTFSRYRTETNNKTIIYYISTLVHTHTFYIAIYNVRTNGKHQASARFNKASGLVSDIVITLDQTEFGMLSCGLPPASPFCARPGQTGFTQINLATSWRPNLLVIESRFSIGD